MSSRSSPPKERRNTVPEGKGRVQRWDFSGEPKLSYLREPAASPDVASWTEKLAEAWIFPTMNVRGATWETDADAQAKVLREAGLANVHAVVVSPAARTAAERKQRHESRVAQIEASARAYDPHAAYEETCRRLGEREEVE